MKDEQQLAGLDGLDSNEWRLRLHEEEKAEAAWSRPRAGRCSGCGNRMGEQRPDVDWVDALTTSPTAAAGAVLGVVSIIPRPSPASA